MSKLYKAHISREHGTFRIVEVLMPIQSIPNWYHCREQGTSRLMNVNRDMLEEIKEPNENNRSTERLMQ